jgi:hypothetical protein
MLRNRRSLQKLILIGIVTMFLLAASDVVWGILNMHFFILNNKHPDGDSDDDDHGDTPEIPAKVLHYKFLLYITSK